MAGGSRLLVPKGPRAESAQSAQRAESPPTIEQLRADLFSVLLPPPPTKTRTYPVHTALGRIMRLRRLTVGETAKVPGGPSAKLLTEVLAGRRGLTREEKDALAVGLGVDRRLLD